MDLVLSVSCSWDWMSSTNWWDGKDSQPNTMFCGFSFEPSYKWLKWNTRNKTNLHDFVNSARLKSQRNYFGSLLISSVKPVLLLTCSNYPAMLYDYAFNESEASVSLHVYVYLEFSIYLLSLVWLHLSRGLLCLSLNLFRLIGSCQSSHLICVPWHLLWHTYKLIVLESHLLK